MFTRLNDYDENKYFKGGVKMVGDKIKEIRKEKREIRRTDC